MKIDDLKIVFDSEWAKRFGVSGSEFRVPGFEFRVSGFEFRVPGYAERILFLLLN